MIDYDEDLRDRSFETRRMSDRVSEKNGSPVDVPEALAKASHFAADARRMIDVLIQSVRNKSARRDDSVRPDDPHAIRLVADLEVRLHAAEAVIAQASQHLARDRVSADAALKIAVGKVLASEIVVLAAEGLFELTGSRDGFAALDRDDALHDPVRWSFHAIGDTVVNGAKLPRASQN